MVDRDIIVFQNTIGKRPPESSNIHMYKRVTILTIDVIDVNLQSIVNDSLILFGETR